VENIDFQQFSNRENRMDAEICRTDAAKYRTDAELRRMDAGELKANVIVNKIETINVQAIVVDDQSGYHNGAFIPVFQDAILAIARNDAIKSGTLRVLCFILGTVDEKNRFVVEIKDIALYLKISDDTVSRAIKQLIEMNIICRVEGARDRSRYVLSDKILNPRVAYKGNTRKLNKDNLPILLVPGGKNPLIPEVFNHSEFGEDFDPCNS